MKIILRITPVFLLFFSILANGQTEKDMSITYQYTAIYKAEYSPDSTDKSNILTEYYGLYVDGETGSSLCAPLKFIRMDSIKRAERLKGNPFGPSMDWYIANGTKATTTVFKQYTNQKIITHDKLAPNISEHYIYEEVADSLQWVSLNDTMIIDNTICNRAKLRFGGRTWHAWYNPEIPISDGPYKFSGLPGLIYQIEDSTGSWKFSLVELKQEKGSFLFNCSDNQHVHISKQKFNINKRYLYDNRILIMKTSGYTFKDENSAKKVLNKDNNWIELYP